MVRQGCDQRVELYRQLCACEADIVKEMVPLHHVFVRRRYREIRLARMAEKGDVLQRFVEMLVLCFRNDGV
jgi:hypothetical protein